MSIRARMARMLSMQKYINPAERELVNDDCSQGRKLSWVEDIPLQLLNMQVTILQTLFILSIWSASFPYASVIPESAIFHNMVLEYDDIMPWVSTRTSRSVPARRYALVLGESAMYKKTGVRSGASSSGPSASTLSRTLIPPVFATSEMSINTTCPKNQPQLGCTCGNIGG